MRSWIEIGSPDAARLHKASKSSPRVAVYTYKDVERLARNLEGERIHRAEELELYAHRSRRWSRRSSRASTGAWHSRWASSARELFVSIGAETLTGRVTRWTPT